MTRFFFKPNYANVSTFIWKKEKGITHDMHAMFDGILLYETCAYYDASDVLE